MEKATVQGLHEMFSKKLNLYRGLAENFQRERECLINVDIDKLWEVSREKEELCSSIESVRRDIAGFVEGRDGDEETEHSSFDINCVMPVIPEENLPGFQRLNRDIQRLKMEIESMRQENIMFIEDSLSFLDDMLSAILREARADTVYNSKRHINRPPGTSAILSRGV